MSNVLSHAVTDTIHLGRKAEKEDFHIALHGHGGPYGPCPQWGHAHLLPFLCESPDRRRKGKTGEGGADYAEPFGSASY